MIHLKHQHAFFQTGKTYSISWRKKQLRKLLKVFKKYKEDLYNELVPNFGYDQKLILSMSLDIKYVEELISYTLKHLSKWTQPKRNERTLFLVRRTSYTIYEPYGTVLIIGLTQRPILSVFEPLINAIAAGNTVVIHISRCPENIREVMDELITSEFSSSYINVMTEDKKIALPLLEKEFDFIYFRKNTDGMRGRNKIDTFSDKKIVMG